MKYVPSAFSPEDTRGYLIMILVPRGYFAAFQTIKPLTV